MTTMARGDKWSKILFNDVHLLRVSAAISAGGDETDCGTLQRALMLSQPAVYRALRTLEGVNLLERIERRTRTEPLRYRRARHPFWNAALDLLSTAEAAS